LQLLLILFSCFLWPTEAVAADNSTTSAAVIIVGGDRD
jgi:hypothetical protein